MQQPNKTQGGGRATKPAAISKKATSSLRAASTPSSKKAAPRSLRQTAAERNDADGRAANLRMKKDNSVTSRNGSRFDGGTLKNRSGAGGTTQPGKPVLKEVSGKTQSRKSKPIATKENAQPTRASKSSKGTSAKRSKSSK